MRVGRALKLICVGFGLGVLLRVVQMLYFFDYETGFYTDGGVMAWLSLGLPLAASLAAAVLCYRSRRVLRALHSPAQRAGGGDRAAVRGGAGDLRRPPGGGRRGAAGSGLLQRRRPGGHPGGLLGELPALRPGADRRVRGVLHREEQLGQGAPAVPGGSAVGRELPGAGVRVLRQVPPPLWRTSSPWWAPPPCCWALFYLCKLLAGVEEESAARRLFIAGSFGVVLTVSYTFSNLALMPLGRWYTGEIPR